MSVQFTIRVDDDLAAFVDRASADGEGSRAEIINRALAREVRRRRAADDARIYASLADTDLDQDAYGAWAERTTHEAWADLD